MPSTTYRRAPRRSFSPLGEEVWVTAPYEAPTTSLAARVVADDEDPRCDLWIVT